MLTRSREKAVRLVTVSLVCLVTLVVNSALAQERNLAIEHANSTSGEQRVALVIGNATYKTQPLGNPIHDAADIAAKLRNLGFEVTLRTNATQKEMTRAITQFGEHIKPGSVALFYYAGHGVQARGRNFLVPVDAEIQTEAGVSSEAVDVDSVLEQLSPARVSMVILDACRNNPFERRFRSAGGGGLAQMDAPKGTLIAYATAPGKTAADGAGRNGLYTGALLRMLDQPGLKVEDVFKRVRIAVSQATQDAQIPWEASSLIGDFYFRTGSATQSASLAPLPAAIVAPPTSANDKETMLWSAVEQSNSAADYDVYLSQYPQGAFAGAARARLDEIKQMVGAEEERQKWQVADKGSRTDVEAYLGRYPQGRFAGMAQLKLARLKREEAELVPGKIFKDCADCPEMVVIPAGSFEMGSNDSDGDDEEKPVHAAMIVRAFALGKTEVTQGQWKAVMGNNPSHFSSCGDNCPVDNVSWNDAQEFVKKLGQKTGKTYRLPSETEWESACRAGSRQKYCGSDNIDSVAWYGDNVFGKTHAVSGKQVNAWGLADMSGNVWEWVEDCWHDNYTSAPTDGSAWTSGCGEEGKRVLRGGSWSNLPQDARSATRHKNSPSKRNQFYGFRLARMLP